MRIKPKVAPFALIVVLILTGCTVRDPTIGSGSIEMSATALEAFEDYKTKTVPRYFAVSEDGRAYYYSFCSSMRCLRLSKANVVYQCETYSNGVPCRIYASGLDVVWLNEG